MLCPICHEKTEVIKTDVGHDGATGRLRNCKTHGRFWSRETLFKWLQVTDGQPTGNEMIAPKLPATDRQPAGNAGGEGGGPTSFLSLVPPHGSERGRARGRGKKAANEAQMAPEFLQFWTLYPRHVAKLAAWRAWQKLAATSELIRIIFDAIKWQRETFLQKEPDRVPHPATWLNGRRWEDERPGASGGPQGTPAGPTAPRPSGWSPARAGKDYGEGLDAPGARRPG